MCLPFFPASVQLTENGSFEQSVQFLREEQCRRGREMKCTELLGRLIVLFLNQKSADPVRFIHRHFEYVCNLTSTPYIWSFSSPFLYFLKLNVELSG